MINSATVCHKIHETLAGIFKWKLQSQHLQVGLFITWSAVPSVDSNNNNIQISKKEIKFQILSPYWECLLVAPLIKICSTSERKLNQGGQLPSPPFPLPHMNSKPELHWFIEAKSDFQGVKSAFGTNVQCTCQAEQKTISFPRQSNCSRKSHCSITKGVINIPCVGR